MFDTPSGRVPITAIRDHHTIQVRFVQRWLKLPDPPAGEDPNDPTSQTYLLGFLIEAVADKADLYCQNAFGFTEYGFDGYQKKSPQQIINLTQSTSNLMTATYDYLTDSVPKLYPDGGEGDDRFGSGDPTGSGGEADAQRIVPRIPRLVEMWILQTIARFFELRPNGLTSESVAGLVSESWGAEEYRSLDGYCVFRGL